MPGGGIFNNNTRYQHMVMGEGDACCEAGNFQGDKSAEGVMVDFYRRDNEELRKFLSAEKVDNNSLRQAVSELKQAVGYAVGFLTMIGDLAADEHFPATDTVNDGIKQLVSQVAKADTIILRKAVAEKS